MNNKPKDRVKITFTCDRETKQKLLDWCEQHDRPISYLCERMALKSLQEKDSGIDFLKYV